MCRGTYLQFWRVFFYYMVVLPALLLVCGKTPLWSQNNEALSSNSAEHLTTWTQLSGQFEQTLSQHEQTLIELSEKLEVSENNGARLTDLLEELSRQNERLKTYNGQIAERMQERDEDLAASYEANERKNRIILKLVIAAILLCVPYLIKAVLWATGKLKR
jgi:cytochrome c-type biogenesis protein CcmH/NrfG